MSLLLSKSINVLYCCLNRFISLITQSLNVSSCCPNQGIYIKVPINEYLFLLSQSFVHIFCCPSLPFSPFISFLFHYISSYLFSISIYCSFSSPSWSTSVIFSHSLFIWLTLLLLPLSIFFVRSAPLFWPVSWLFVKHPVFSGEWYLQLLGWWPSSGRYIILTQVLEGKVLKTGYDKYETTPAACKHGYLKQPMYLRSDDPNKGNKHIDLLGLSLNNGQPNPPT